MSSIGGLVTARVVEGVFFSSCFLLISFSFLCRGGNGRHEGKQCCDIWLYLSDSKFYVNSHLKRAERCHTDPKTFHLKAAQQPIRFYIQQIYRQTRVNVWFWEDMSTSCLGYAMIHNPSRLIPSLWKYGDSRFLQTAPTCAAGVFAERFSAFQGIFDPSISPVGPLPLSLGDGCLSLESQIASLSHHCDLTLFVSFRNVPSYLLFPPFSILQQKWWKIPTMAEVILIILLVLWLCMCWCFLIPCCQRCVCRECEVHHELGKKSPLDGGLGKGSFQYATWKFPFL